jgi:hypothetical protein
MEDLQSYKEWLLDYLDNQHGLQGTLAENCARGVVGLAKTIFPLQWPLAVITGRVPDETLRRACLGLATAVGGSFAALWGFSPRVRFWMKHWPWKEPLFAASAWMTVAWAGFALFWEPTNYYWSVVLFPVATMGAIGLKKATEFLRRCVMVLLWIMIAGNIAGNLWESRLDAARFPDPELETIHSHVRKETDRLIFLKRAWNGNADYDLLMRVLRMEGYRVSIFLDDEVISTPDRWEARLQKEIEATLHHQGRVFVSSLLRDPEAFADLPDINFLAPYVAQRYVPLNGAELFSGVQQVLGHYPTQPSDVVFNADRFEVLSNQPRLGKRKGTFGL